MAPRRSIQEDHVVLGLQPLPPALTFEREGLAEAIGRLAKDRKWPHASYATIKNDVACFVRTYVALSPASKSNQEDSLESPLTELGLIKPIGRRGGFRFVRGPKPSLGVGAFCYVVTDFWNERFPNANTLSLEALTHEPGSPGRVFLLDENDVVDMLAQMEDATKGAYRWSETAGLKQLIRSGQMRVGNQQKWDTFVKERSGGNGSVVGLPEQVVVAFAAG